MKALKSFVVFSLLGVVSLVGCGGVNDAGGEDTLGTTQQAECFPPPYPNCTLIGPVSCANNITYICQRSTYGCSLFRGDTCQWSGGTDSSCASYQQYHCGL
jgi:hypothetical protein